MGTYCSTASYLFHQKWKCNRFTVNNGIICIKLNHGIVFMHVNTAQSVLKKNVEKEKLSENATHINSHCQILLLISQKFEQTNSVLLPPETI